MSFPLEQLPYDPTKLYEKPLIELTQSSVATFMACPQKFVFRYLMLLRRRGISIPLLVGSAVHRGLEILIAPAADGNYEQRLPQCEVEIDKVFQKAIDGAFSIGGLEDKIEHGRAQAHAILNAWWIIYGSDFQTWKPIAPELTVRSDPSAAIGGPLAPRMAGMIDAVILDERGVAWILEHKTRKSLSNFSVNSLELDLQALWYIILARITLPKHFPGVPSPQGFMYDAIMKPQHRMNADGFPDLKQRMRDAMIESPEKYFALTPIEIKESTLERAWDNFQRIVRHMDALSPSSVYMNLKSCDDYGGCPYKPLCQNGANAADPIGVLNLSQIELFEVMQPHEELMDDAVASSAETEEKYS